jgi:hypothetical protein
MRRRHQGRHDRRGLGVPVGLFRAALNGHAADTPRIAEHSRQTCSCVITEERVNTYQRIRASVSSTRTTSYFSSIGRRTPSSSRFQSSLSENFAFIDSRDARSGIHARRRTRLDPRSKGPDRAAQRFSRPGHAVSQNASVLRGKDLAGTRTPISTTVTKRSRSRAATSRPAAISF